MQPRERAARGAGCAHGGAAGSGGGSRSRSKQQQQQPETARLEQERESWRANQTFCGMRPEPEKSKSAVNGKWVCFCGSAFFKKRGYFSILQGTDDGPRGGLSSCSLSVSSVLRFSAFCTLRVRDPRTEEVEE